ncbi:MAG TPA: accessory factor UbiK family protein [Gammaproteobacteria bacterium]|nr:accessory factor UbiK family protein [Gammaproteobacteria bacterium]
MINDNRLDELIKKTLSFLPEDLARTRQDIEKNLKTGLQATLAKMDLVTREEFDTQAELLSRTRATLDEMEKKLASLEQLLDEHNKQT